MDYKQEVQGIKAKFSEYKEKTLKLTTEKNSTEQELLEWQQLIKDIDMYINRYQSIQFPNEEEKRELESWIQQKVDAIELINTYANRFEDLNSELELVTDTQLEEQADLIKTIDQFKEVSDKVKDIENASKKLKVREKDKRKIVKVQDYRGRNKEIHSDLVEDYKKLSQVKNELLKKNNAAYEKLILQIEENSKNDNKKVDFEKVTSEKKFSDKRLESMTDEEKIVELEKRIEYILNPDNHKNTGEKIRRKFNGQTIQIPVVWRGRLFQYDVELQKAKRRVTEKTEIASQVKEKLDGFSVDPSKIPNEDNIVNGFRLVDPEKKKQDAIEFINSITPDFSQNNVNPNTTNPLAANLINQYNENVVNLDYINKIEQQGSSHNKPKEYEDIYSHSKDDSKKEQTGIPSSLKEPVNSVRKLRKRNKIKDSIKRTAAAIVASVIMITTSFPFVSYISKKITERVNNPKPYEQVVEAEVVEDDPNVINVVEQEVGIQIGGPIKVSEGASIYKSAKDSMIAENQYKPYFSYDSDRLAMATIVELDGKHYNINATQTNANESLKNLLNQGGRIVSVLTTNKNNQNNWDGKRQLSKEEYTKQAEGWFNYDNINTTERRIVR